MGSLDRKLFSSKHAHNIAPIRWISLTSIPAKLLAIYEIYLTPHLENNRGNINFLVIGTINKIEYNSWNKNDLKTYYQQWYM